MVLLILAFVSFIFLFFLQKQFRKNQEFHLPPGPRGLPLVGNLFQFDSLNTHLYYTKLGKTYGSIFAIRLLGRSVVVIQSLELAKEVLQTQDQNFCSRVQTRGRKRLSYNGLDIAFSPCSDYLREIKKIIIVNLLSSKCVDSYAPIRQEEVSRMIQKVSSLSSASKIVNLSHLVLNFAISTAGKITFGERYDDEKLLGSLYYSLLYDVEYMFTAFFFSDYSCFGGWIDKITGQRSKLEKIFKELDAIFEKIIDDHLHKVKLRCERQDIVDVLLGLMNDDSFPFKFTMNHVKAILLNLFSGGANTTTAAVIWTVTELVKTPIAMKKVQEELRSVVLNQGCHCLTLCDISNLKYFKAVMKESVRLHPPVPLLLPREAIRKSNIKGYDILPKTFVLINAWAIGRDPKYWEDPDKFMPERFLKESSTELKGGETMAMKMIPFGAGKRMCPGNTFGLANIEVALANLLYSFDWELPADLKKEDFDNKALPGLVTHKENQLYLVAKKFEFA